MKIAIRYQSRGSNTRVVAEYIGEKLGVVSLPISESIEGEVDVLVVGGGVYAWNIDKSLKEFLANLDSTKVKCVAPFTTAGGMDKTDRIAEIARGRGIEIHSAKMGLKVLLRNHIAIGGGEGKFSLNDKDRARIDKFVSEILAKKGV